MDVPLSVGDLVVYASHGIGRVTAREARGARGELREVVVLEFAEGLSVTLPLERALECVRALSSEAELVHVGRTLGEEDVFSEEVWQKRLKLTKEKVSAGAALGLAEVVRDGLRRDQKTSARGEAIRLSLSERQLYLKARRLLADEISASRGVESSEADAWISDQLGEIAVDEKL
jgi:CarD family transcriptional regulator